MLATMRNAQYLVYSLWKANKVDCSTVRNYSSKNRRLKKIITNHKTHTLETKYRNNNIILGSLEITPKVEKLLENKANTIKLQQKWQNQDYKRLLYPRTFLINMKSWWNEIKTLQETQLGMANLNREQSRKKCKLLQTYKQRPSLSLNAFIRKAFHVFSHKDYFSCRKLFQ